jgi:hypothetical protein
MQPRSTFPLRAGRDEGMNDSRARPTHITPPGARPTTAITVPAVSGGPPEYAPTREGIKTVRLQASPAGAASCTPPLNSALPITRPQTQRPDTTLALDRPHPFRDDHSRSTSSTCCSPRSSGKSSGPSTIWPAIDHLPETVKHAWGYATDALDVRNTIMEKCCS